MENRLNRFQEQSAAYTVVAVPSMVTSKPAISGHFKTGQRRASETGVVLTFCLLVEQVHFGSPATRTAFEDVTVMEQAVEHGSDRGAVTE